MRGVAVVCGGAEDIVIREKVMKPYRLRSSMGTSKNRFEKGKWVECAECDESRRSKAVCLTRRCNTMLQSEITGDGMDAVASEISLVE